MTIEPFHGDSRITGRSPTRHDKHKGLNDKPFKSQPGGAGTIVLAKLDHSSTISRTNPHWLSLTLLYGLNSFWLVPTPP